MYNCVIEQLELLSFSLFLLHF